MLTGVFTTLCSHDAVSTGICSDGVHVFVTDMDANAIYELRLTHTRATREGNKAEQERRAALRAGGRGQPDGDATGLDGPAGGAVPGSVAAADAEAVRERRKKELQRDAAMQKILKPGRPVHAMLGLRSTGAPPEHASPEHAASSVPLPPPPLPACGLA